MRAGGRGTYLCLVVFSLLLSCAPTVAPNAVDGGPAAGDGSGASDAGHEGDGATPDATPDAALADRAGQIDTGARADRGAEAGPALVACARDEDCGQGLRCQAPLCLPVPNNGIGDPCQQDHDCDRGVCLILGGVEGAVCVPCRGDSDCEAGAFCADHQCLATRPRGQTCARDAQCLSEHCLGQRCVACAGDADCAGSEYCASGMCFAQVLSSMTCTRDAMCRSGQCRDGLCAGCSDGGDCPPETYCSPAQRCEARHDDGEPSSSAEACTSGYLLDGRCAACDGDQGCAAEQICRGGGCVGLYPAGQSCADGTDCRSGQCVGGRCQSRSLSCSREDLATTLAERPDISRQCRSSSDGGGVVQNTAWFDELFGQRSLDGEPPPCLVQNACYQSCGCAKDDCDTQFYHDMLRWCDRWYANDGPGLGPDRMSCYLAAEAYALQAHGDFSRSAYAADQLACAELLPREQLRCGDDSHCASDAFCDTDLCYRDKASGYTCRRGTDCQSGACVDGRCSDCEACGAGSFCVDGQCQPRRSAGEICQRDDECASGSCRYLRCAACGVAGGCDETEYCADGTCLPRRGLSKACAADNMCTSGHCSNLSCQSCQDDRDCADGEFCLADACHAPKDNGQPCSSDRMCESGHCSSNICTPCGASADCGAGQFCALGVCHSTKTDGLPCSEDEQCDHGHCDTIISLLDWESPGICGECRGTVGCDNSHEFCLFGVCHGKKGVGQACNGDDWCETQHCAQPASGAAMGHAVGGACSCNPTSGLDEGCASDEYCARALPLQDLPFCAPKLPYGVPCPADRACQSSHCEQDPAGVSYICGCSSDAQCDPEEFCETTSHACMDKLPLGVPCTNDPQCQSGLCHNAHCAVCEGEPQIISDFEDLSGWSKLSPETTIVHEGTAAGRFIVEQGRVNFFWSGDPALDLSAYDHLGFWLYSEQANAQGLAVILESPRADSTDWSYYYHEVIVDWSGWSWVWLAKDDFVATRSPRGWDSISTINFSAFGWGHEPLADTNLVIDEFVLASWPSGHDPCDADSYCESNSGLCAPKLSFPAPCTDAYQCVSGICGDIVGVGPSVCGCASNAECDGEEFCETNSHACVNKLPLTSPCTDSFQCQSDLCHNSHCAQCADDSPPQIIDELENVRRWQGLSPDRVVVHDGYGAGRFETSSTTAFSLTADPALDLSAHSHVGFWLYSELANQQGLSILFDSPRPGSNDWSYYRLPLQVNWSGWKWIWLAKADFGEARSPLGWEQITKISVYAHGWDNTPLTDTALILDHLLLASWPGGQAPCADNQFCETNSGLCTPKLSFPAVCTDGYQCVSGVCGDVVGVGPSVCGCASQAECDTDEFCETNSHACATRFPLTTPCTDGYQCQSGLCHNAHCADCLANGDCSSQQFCETGSGLCVNKLSFPAPCTDAYQCVSGVCGDIAGVGPSVCGCAGNGECNSDEFCETNSHACVNKLPLTSPCTDGTQCQSGLCHNAHCADCLANGDCSSQQFCETNSGLCSPKLSFPAVCTDGYQCVSGVCGDVVGVGPSVCGCTSNGHCSSSEYCETNTHACVDKLPAPSPCSDGYQCISGSCRKCSTGCIDALFVHECWTVCSGCQSFCVANQCITICAPSVGYCE